jgi:hypothetical protein
MSCYNSTIIDAAPETVWALLKNFHDMSWAQGVIETLEPVGAVPANQPGAARLLNGVIRETLIGIDDVDMTVSYSVDDGPAVLAADQVTNYRAIIAVRPVTATSQSFVEWQTVWDAAKGDVKGFCDPLYIAMLTSLTAKFH